MLKQNAHIDELKQVHTRSSPMPKSLEVKTKKEMKEKDKLINPKQVFEKTPKNTKSKSSYRNSDVDNKNKLPVLFEDRLT